MYDYQAMTPEELSISQGQVLAVFRTHDDGWWEAVGFGMDGKERIGLFPSNFCKKMHISKEQHAESDQKPHQHHD